MAFDPNLPAANSPLSSEEMRDQFNGLKEHVDSVDADVMNRVDDLENTRLTQGQLEAGSANNIGALATLDISISEPPTTEEVTTIVNKLNDLIEALKR